MGQPIDYFHKRIAGVEKQLSDTKALLKQSEEDRKAMEYRVKKLERSHVDLEGTLARYIRQRLSADNAALRWQAGLTDEQFEQAERLKAIELVGFPHLYDDVSRIIGKADGAKSASLDRRPDRRKR